MRFHWKGQELCRQGDRSSQGGTDKLTYDRRLRLPRSYGLAGGKMDKDQQRHSEESEQMRKSLDNNTKALLELGAHIKES